MTAPRGPERPVSIIALQPDPLSVHRTQPRAKPIVGVGERPCAPERRDPPCPARPCDFEGFVGTSAAMTAVYRLIGRLAPSRASVFVTGESGTGKEVTAEALHRRSGRPDAAFVAINCSAIPRDLMESEIFGHVRGAFTGAQADRIGAAELADGGTLFLDEVCEMEPALQAKLLRLIQTGTVQRVGDARPRKVDLRLVCATNRDPAREVADGRFRADLFYRLAVLPVHLPPLRERGLDVLALAEAFVERFAAEEGRAAPTFAPSARDALLAHDWPGNVRELQNVIRRVIVLHDAPVVEAGALDLAGGPGTRTDATRETGPEGRRPRVEAHALDLVEPLWAQEKRIIEATIDRFGGSIARAASALEISPSTIYRKRVEWQARSVS